jgi:hypothetical protein
MRLPPLVRSCLATSGCSRSRTMWSRSRRAAAWRAYGGTYLGAALAKICKLAHNRLIVVTDEQSHDRVPDPVAAKSYMINVASNRNGVGYGRWIHIDGFSEGAIRFIAEAERSQ